MSNAWNREELAWAAGFVDGEAHIGLIKQNKTGAKRMAFVVCQTDDGPLQRFQAIIGMGKIYGPYVHGVINRNRKPYKQFHLHTFEEVQQVICMLFPWLSAPKRKQAINALRAHAQHVHEKGVAKCQK